MSKTDEFWEFAREAILLACNAEVDEDKQVCFTLRELDASGVTGASSR